MNKQQQQMIDNYFERKQAIERLKKGVDGELDLDSLGDKIKAEITSGIYGDKNVAMAPRLGYPTLNYKKVKAGVTPAVWEKIEPLVETTKNSVSLTISLTTPAIALPDYKKSGFKMAAVEMNEDSKVSIK